jgi:hypothetical protein
MAINARSVTHNLPTKPFADEANTEEKEMAGGKAEAVQMQVNNQSH